MITTIMSKPEDVCTVEKTNCNMICFSCNKVRLGHVYKRARIVLVAHAQWYEIQVLESADIKDLCADIKSFFEDVISEISKDNDFYRKLCDSFNDLLHFKCSRGHLTPISGINEYCKEKGCIEKIQDSDQNMCWVHVKGIASS